MIKTLIFTCLLSIFAVNNSNRQPVWDIDAAPGLAETVTEADKTASAAFINTYLPGSEQSRSLSITYASYGCFHYESETLVIDKADKNIVISILRNGKKKADVYVVPNAVFQQAIIKFNSRCRFILQQEEQRKPAEGYQFDGTSVRMLEIKDKTHSISVSAEETNPCAELKWVLLDKRYLLKNTTANMVVFGAGAE